MTMNKIYSKLRKGSKGQYLLLAFCIFLSVLLLTSFSLMYFGPTVQTFLPEGGDTRKMASLLLAVTALGCFLFTVYASNLFFRYKSREYGVFMALGLSKKRLRGLLFRELSMVTALSSLAGLSCAMPVSFVVWKIFELFIISTEQMTYRFGPSGFLPGIAFAVCLALMLSLAAGRFIRRSSITDILRTQHKSEMVREIKPWTFPSGLVLMAAGVLLGAGLPQFSAAVLHYNPPAAINAVYLLSAAGIYMVLLSIVSQSRLKRNKKKYYRNLVSVSLMRFTARAATRSMCVIVLLLFVCCFSAFYGMQYGMIPDYTSGAGGKAFSLHYPALETQITEEDIYTTADRYGIEIQDYIAETGADLVISYRAQDFTEDGSRYIQVYRDKDRTSLFLSESGYNAITGQKAEIKPGTYKTITAADYQENFFDYVDGLDVITNPDTGESLSVSFDGTLEYNALASMSLPFAYVISDKDYTALTAGLTSAYEEMLVLFNVADEENSYDFAKDLIGQYAEHATQLSSHMAYWDPWEEQKVLARGEEYGYSGEVDTRSDNPMLLSDWKYAPQFNIVMKQDIMQLISVYVMLCLYIFIISLATISVMTYVRSISVAADNRRLFISLDKLGADRNYKRLVLRNQLQKIFQYPTLASCGLSLLFALAMDYFNDGRITSVEVTALLAMVGITVAVAIIMMIVYRYAMKRAGEIVGL